MQATPSKVRAQSSAQDELVKSLPKAKAVAALTPDAKSSSSSSSSSSSKAAVGGTSAALPLEARSIDRWFVVWFGIFWFTVM
jgi:hypothetical protein